MDLNKNGKLIRDLRKARGMTQKEVAESLGVLPKTVSKWETGHGFPDVSAVPCLSEILGVDEKTLLSGSLTQNPEEVGNMKKRNSTFVRNAADFCGAAAKAMLAAAVMF